MYDKIFDKLPSMDDLNGIRLLPLADPDTYDLKWDEWWNPMRSMNATLIYYKKSDYPETHLTFIGNTTGMANKIHFNAPLCWKEIDDWIGDYYLKWRAKEYEVIGDGLYRYRP